MPIGVFGEVVGTTGSLDGMPEAVKNFPTKVAAPKNPKVLRGDKAEQILSPSQYIFQNSLSTQQKLATMHEIRWPKKQKLLDMGDTSYQKFTEIPVDEAIFQPFPSEIYFQNFKPNEQYEIPLVLKNNDKVPRLVKVIQAETPYFKIISPPNISHKVSPGLSLTFRVVFLPDETKDYNHELVVITERERFIIPVKAIGPRAVIDFPDEINFSNSPVNFASKRTILVRNIGNREAKFRMSCDEPWTVSPTSGQLKENEQMQINVDFDPKSLGDQMGALLVHYDTGETTQTKLCGIAEQVNIRLDKTNVRLDPTYIGRTSYKKITLSNHSNIIANFKFSVHRTQQQEDEEKAKLCQEVDRDAKVGADRLLEEVEMDPTLKDKLAILYRTFENRKRNIQADPLLFMEDALKIEPNQGVLWPNSSIDLYVVFKPQTQSKYICRLFCAVSGRAERLELFLTGDGCGPKMQLSFEHLSLGQIFINSEHSYELVLANKSDIDAIFNVVPQESESQFAECFQFSPFDGIVTPGGHQAILVTFRSKILGTFKQEFLFQIDGSREKLSVVFEGTVVGPTFHFDVPMLNFGTVAYGFPAQLRCTLENTSLIPMQYTLSVPSDVGTGKPWLATDTNDDQDSPRSRFVRERPKEFELLPSQGRLAAMSRQEILINFVPNQARKYEAEMTISIQGVGSDVMSLPIVAKCIVPDVKIANRLLQFGRCFLNYEYTKDIELLNNSNVPAKYEVLTQQLAQAIRFTRKPSAISWKGVEPETDADADVDADADAEADTAPEVSERTDSVALDESRSVNPNISYFTPTRKGIIAPKSSVRIPITVRVTGKEEQECDVFVKIFGSTGKPVSARITCFAEGPVVNVEPNSINFGQIEVLTDTPKMVTLANESLISAQFTARVLRSSSVFRVEPSSGEIPPHQATTLVITANLDDCLEFEDKLDISVINGHHRTVLLKAKGFGSTIVIEPPLRPQMQIGPFFSNTRIEQRYKLTNRGRRHQQLVWMNEQYPSYLRIKAPKASGAPGSLGNPIFTLDPIRASLEPGESSEMVLRCYVDTPKRVSETLLCHAIIGRQGGKELIKRIDLSADFIRPLVQLSRNQLNYEVEKRPQDSLTVMQDSLEVRNMSLLPLQITARLLYPFSLLVAEQLNGEQRTLLLNQHSFTLDCDTSATLTVQFDPAYKNDLHTRVLDETLALNYEGHPHQDLVKLHSAVHFPNVTFDCEAIDFGCILNYTEQVRSVRMTNSSRLPVKYRWSFLVNGSEDGPATFIFHRNNTSRRFAPAHGDAGSFQVRFNDAVQAIDLHDSADEGIGQEAPGYDAELFIPVPDAATAPNSRSVRRETRINPRLQELLARDSEPIALGVEEIFDIMPLFGELQPGEAEDIQFTFFAHADIACNVKALCTVEGGPVYQLSINGQGSVLQYEFNTRSIDLGCMLYDQIAQAQFVLRNTGSVPFHFVALDLAEMPNTLQPGQLAMIPREGHVDANGEQVLLLKFHPGSPANYNCKFHIQVAHFEPEVIHVHAEAVFPSITLDLPRHDDDQGRYYSLLKQACAALKAEWKEEDVELPVGNFDEVLDPEVRHKFLQQHIEKLLGGKPTRQTMLEKYASNLEVQREVERLAVANFAQNAHCSNTQRGVSQNSCLSETERGSTDRRLRTSHSQVSNHSRRTKAMQNSPSHVLSPTRPQLPDYVLDFDCVILGTVKTFVVRATNTGHFSASLQIDKRSIANSGFSIDLHTVRDLPGYPQHETVSFVVTCDPRGANLGVGRVEVPAILNIINGPQIVLRLRANVVMPDLHASSDVVDFEDVKCGECKIVNIQLCNAEPVPCDWSVLYERRLTQSARRAKKAAKFIPLHLRKQFLEAKMREQLEEELQGHVFEVIPPAGSLGANQRINVRIKFTPKEEKMYSERITFRVGQSSTRCLVVCRGKGEEPRLDFDPVHLEFGPTLPHCTSEDKMIVVKNPCKFPIEFYSLEYDKTYLEEEKILRMLPGYDEFKTLLLPPRTPGEKLPNEILEFYEDQVRRYRDAENLPPGVIIQSETLTDSADQSGGLTIPIDQQSVAPTIATGNKLNSPSHAGTLRDRDSNVNDREAQNALSTMLSTQRDGGASALGGLGMSPTPSGGLVEKAAAATVGEFETTPVTAAIARHLGIDLTPEGRAAHNRRGIAIIVHGYPQTGKTSTSVLLARRYSAAMLTIDQIITDAMANSQSSAAAKAREMCIEAASKFAEQQRQIAAEQAAAAQAEQEATVEDSGHGRRRSTHMQKGKPDRLTAKHAKEHKAPTVENLDDSQSLKLAAPVARRLSMQTSAAGEDGIMSTVLPEEVVIDLISERLHLSDCLKGVIFDGLDTLFCPNSFIAFQCVLRALNNRKHIYLVYLKQDLTQVKELDRLEKEEQARRELEADEEERKRLEEMSEDEYAALPEDQRAQIDARQLKLKKERLRREHERKQEQARIREQQEIEARRLEEERLRRRGKKLPPNPQPQKGAKPLGKDTLPGMQLAKAPNALQPGQNQLIGMSDRPESHLSAEQVIKEDEKKKKNVKDGKRSKADDELGEEEHNPEAEAELKMQLKFKNLEYELKMMVDVAQFWDRTTLQVKRVNSPLDGGDHDQDGHGASKKTQKGAKTSAEKEDKEKKDKEKQAHDKEKPVKVKDGGMADMRQFLEGASHREDQPPAGSYTFERPSSDVLAPLPPFVFWPPEDSSFGMPYFVIDCTHKDREAIMQLTSLNKLPRPDAVLDGIGIGPSGPPLPPPATFSVISFPERRNAPAMDRFEYYTFVGASVDDPNLLPPKVAKEQEEESNTEKEKKQDRLTPTRTGSKKTADKKEKASDKDKGRSRSPPGVGSRKAGSISENTRESRLAHRDSQQISDEPSAQPSEGDAQTAQKLQRFRWLVPAGGEVKLCIRFYSEEVGHIDQTFNFELVGTRRRYQLHCRGVCSFPAISKEPRVLFHSRKRLKQPNEIVSKKYILANEVYEFGPLLVGKSRDKFKEGRYPENMEKFTISNTSPLAADVSFCFYQDSRSDTFILDPPSMTLAPGESQELSVWAYPKSPGRFDDTLVCCIRENPEPVLIKIACDGVRPELQLDNKTVNFDKVLLHRKETRTIYMRNPTLLPICWKAIGVDSLGEDFTVSQEQGIIDARTEFVLQVHYRAMKPAKMNPKKGFRIEVFDMENIMGIVQSESIQVLAEAYDVALDMSFQKGDTGGIDFHTVRAFDDARQAIVLKNRGTYDIEYRFEVESKIPSQSDIRDLRSYFNVVPQRGSLSSSERATNIMVFFKCDRELEIIDEPIIKVYVIEPTMSQGKETVACIPIRISVKSVFSKYAISPANDINFGFVSINTRKSRSFLIENKGEFEFKYVVQKFSPRPPDMPQANAPSTLGNFYKKLTMSRERMFAGSRAQDLYTPAVGMQGSTVSNEFRLFPNNVRHMNNQQANVYSQNTIFAQFTTKRVEARQDQPLQQKLQLGMFTVYPAFGVIGPGASVNVTVDCIAETPGKGEDLLGIEITDRNPSDNPDGIPYKLFVESCVPSISALDYQSIFEEHRVYKNLAAWQQYKKLKLSVVGIFAEEENRFVFENVLIGARSQARFKISNTNKVPCDIMCSMRATRIKSAAGYTPGGKVTSQSVLPPDIFDVEPQRLSIGAHAHQFVTVTFAPTALQAYSALFEVAVDNLPANVVKPKNIQFDLYGEGTLPRVSIVKPTLRNKRGQHLLQFRKMLLGRYEALPLVLINDGTLPSKVDIDLLDPDSSFSLQPAESDTASRKALLRTAGMRIAHTASVELEVGEQIAFDVVFRPLMARSSQAQLQITVVNNQYEDTIVQLVGEGYEDDVVFDNINRVLLPHYYSQLTNTIVRPATSGARSIASPQPSANTPTRATVTHHAEDAALLASLEEEAAAAKSNHLFFGDCHVKELVSQCFTMTNRGRNCVRFQFPENDSHFKISPALGHLHAGCSKDVKVTFVSDIPFTAIEHSIMCKLVQIVFEEGADNVADWDDRQQVVKWVDITLRTHEEPETDANAPPAPITTTRIGKRKLVVPEPEPRSTELPDTARTIELLASVNCGFAKYECKIDSITLKETPLLETLVYSFSLRNVGSVAYEYDWSLQLLDAPDNSSMPFTIEPKHGRIFPDRDEAFTLKFAPLDVGLYNAKLTCSIPNVDPKLAPSFDIPVRARALLPYVHFELDESDYLSAGRRPVNMRGPAGLPPGTRLDPTTRCVEFQAIGLGERIRRSFAVVNPTNRKYNFQWKEEIDENVANNVKQRRVFTCTPISSTLEAGRKQEVTFEYCPSQFGVTESFWQFRIPELDLSVPFLMIGETHEPLVTFDRAHVRFKPLLVGHEASETIYLVNSEPREFQFEFLPASLMAPGEGVTLKVSPKNGAIGANSRLPIELRFKPNSDKELCFRAACKIKNKPQPVTINVKCEGYKIDCDLLIETNNAQWASLAPQAQRILEPTKDGVQFETTEIQLAPVDFGEVELHEDSSKQLAIVNMGKFNFDFRWEIKALPGVKKNIENLMRQYVRFEPECGYVKIEERFLCNVLFKPLTRVLFGNFFQLRMIITSGPIYTTTLLGSVIEPQVEFSWTKWDFGPCYLYKPGLPVQQAMLDIKNVDMKPISLQSLYTPTAQLRVVLEPTVLSPGQSITVPVQFYPKEPIKYREQVQFELNSLTQHTVEVIGQGIELKVEAANAMQRLVDFGAMRIGETYKKVVPIVNRSCAPVTFRLVCTPNSSELKDATVDWKPQKEITLQAGEEVKVDVTITPRKRMAHFCEEMLAEYFSSSLPVFAIQGSCHGVEFQLDTNAIAFGAVVHKCQLTRKLIMNNTGDIGATFRWDAQRFKPDFTIEPVQGYLAPGMQVTFDITFSPPEICYDIRYDNLKCFIEGGDPLLLTLTAMCIGVQPLKETLSFATVVRQKEIKALHLINRTNQLWTLKPVIEGPYWTGPETFVVEPMQTRQYELTYKPLTMTTDGKKHTGTIFFALPDGSGLLYNLVGLADPPKPLNKIVREIPSKVHYTELLQVFNWLKKPQRFKAKIELVKPDKLDLGMLIKGLEYVDVPGSGKRDFKLNFFAHKETSQQFKVTFTNEQTGEYQFYELSFKIGRPTALQSIVLTTTVRQSAHHSIKLENPLAQQIAFQSACTSAEVLMPAQFVIPANSEGTFNIEYFALKAGESQAKLELSCSELGLFVYDLILKALPGGTEPALHFNTPLGTTHIQSARFIHYARQKVDYVCKVDHPEFHVEKTVTAAPVGAGGSEVSIDVTYEPSSLGEVRATLTISSAAGGEYQFPLFGVCTSPKPQGPFVIKAGSTTAISLRNVFPQPTAFLFQVDNPAFHLPKSTETIKPKKEYKLMVAFDGTASGEKGFVMAKLVVSCARSTGQTSQSGQAQNVQWIYYLKGIAQ